MNLSSWPNIIDKFRNTCDCLEGLFLYICVVTSEEQSHYNILLNQVGRLC